MTWRKGADETESGLPSHSQLLLRRVASQKIILGIEPTRFTIGRGSWSVCDETENLLRRWLSVARLWAGFARVTSIARFTPIGRRFALGVDLGFSLSPR